VLRNALRFLLPNVCKQKKQYVHFKLIITIKNHDEKETNWNTRIRISDNHQSYPVQSGTGKGIETTIGFLL
jgi:hypothetical protein